MTYDIEQLVADATDLTEPAQPKQRKPSRIADVARANYKLTHDVKNNNTDEQHDTETNTGLPIIIVNDRQDRHVMADALQSFVTANERNFPHPIVYIRGGVMTRIVRDERGNYSAIPLDDAATSCMLAHTADWKRENVTKHGTVLVNAHVPGNTVKMVIASNRWDELPPLAGIVQSPVFAPDGTLHSASGYNPATRLYCTSTMEIGDTTPTDTNVIKSIQLIRDELFGEFPFKDAASRAHAIGLTILPFVRHMIRGATPLHLTDASTPGTGKTLINILASVPSSNGTMATITPCKSEDEWSKKIISMLMAAGTHVLIDNIPQNYVLDSAKLATALMIDEFEDRLLGANKMVRVSVRNVWCANGNNVKLTNELARRSIWIRLDANVEKPWERTNFKHDDIVGWAQTHRAELATSVITLVKKWIAQGCPKWTGRAKGSYTAWSNVIGGILHSVGIDGFLGNENELYDATMTEHNAWGTFVNKWCELYSGDLVTSETLFKIASHPDKIDPNNPPPPDEWLGLLDDELGAGNEMSRRVRLGKGLEARRDAVFGGYKIVRGTGYAGKPRWQLVKPV